LPNSFRFTGSKGHALAVQEKLVKQYVPEITEIEFEGQKVTPPEPITWFPDQLAWQMTTPKNVVRRFPPFKAFQQFLVSETSVGNISRQEIVSMIPPLLLDVRPGHTVLDLCAAPGSKSAQLIEAVHSGEEARMKKILENVEKDTGRAVSPDGEKMELEMSDETLMADTSDDGRATGLLVANDVDYKRAHMLIHQMKRLNSPNLIVTNHDATMFPSIKLPSESEKGPNRYLKFDRILADVPCSGDGTTRKNPNIWKDWTPGNGLGLHQTQVKILVRSLQMLKAGGRVVYSTCSMNPVENEAVVSAAIDRCGGLEKVDVIEASSILPGLKHKAGKRKWQVMDKTGRLWSSFKEIEDHRAANGDDGLSKLYEGMFPISDDFPLERCMRVEPHQQDTGGFFITVLEKKSEIRARPEPSTRTASTIRQEAAAKDMTTNPSKPLPSITAVVDEIESKGQADGSIPHIESLDVLAPPTLPHDEIENASAASRMNQEMTVAKSAIKRPAEDPAHEEVPVKKVKTNDDIDNNAATVSTEGQRQVHYPPPPAVQESRDNQLASQKDAKVVSNGQPSEQSSKKSSQHYEEPFKYLDSDQKDIEEIFANYEINSRFPRDRFMVRNAAGEPARTIYYTTSLARDILTENEGKGMKFVHCGIKMFVKQDVQRADQCPWRIQTDGLQLLDSWVSESRIVRLKSRKTLYKLLKEMFPKVSGLAWQELNEIGERVRDMQLGCSVLRVESGEGEDAFAERMVLPLWRSLFSVNLMLPKEDRKAMLLRLYNDNGDLIDHQKERKTAEEAKVEPIVRQPVATDEPAPGEHDLVGQRAADMEEISAEYGAPSDDDEDEMNEEGGVRLDLDGGVALEPNAAEREAKLQLREEAAGVVEGGVDTQDNEDIREATRKEARDSGLQEEANASTKPGIEGEKEVPSEAQKEAEGDAIHDVMPLE